MTDKKEITMKDLVEEIEELKGQIGTLTNALIYMQPRVQANEDRSNLVYLYQSEQEAFQTWYRVQHAIHESAQKKE